MQQKIHKILFLFLLLMAGGAAYADGADKCGCRMQREEPGPPPPHHGGKGCKFDFEQFRKDLTKHISTRAGFTAKEAQAFFPLFFEMKAKQRSYMRKTVRAYRRVEKEDLKEKECQKILREVENLESKKDEMERTYMQRLEKAFSVASARALSSMETLAVPDVPLVRSPFSPSMMAFTL